MKHNQVGLAKITALYNEYCATENNQLQLFFAIQNFLKSAYKGRQVCYLKKNFPQLADILKDLSKKFNCKNTADFLSTHLGIETLQTSRQFDKITELAIHLHNRKQASIHASDFAVLDSLTEIKELLGVFTNTPASEEELLKRFNSKLFINNSSKHPLPTRVDILSHLVKNGAPQNLQETFGPHSYAKLVKIAAQNKKSSSEFVQCFLKDLSNQKNVLPLFFENKKMAQMAKEYSGRNCAALQILSRATNLTEGTIKYLCGNSADSASTQRPLQLVYELMNFTHARHEYFNTQSKLALRNFLLEYKILFHSPSVLESSTKNYMQSCLKPHIIGMCELFNIPFNTLISTLKQADKTDHTAKSSPKSLINSAESTLKTSTEQKAKAMLATIYPDGKVKNPGKHKALNTLLKTLATNKTVHELVESWGFEFVETRGRKSIAQITSLEQARELLLKAYPNGVVKSLFKHQKLHGMVKRFANQQNKTINQIVTDCNLLLEEAPNAQKDQQLAEQQEKEIRSWLTENFGQGGKVYGLVKNYQKEYRIIQKLAKLQDKSVKELLVSWGFTYGESRKRPISFQKIKTMLEQTFADTNKKVFNLHKHPKLNNLLNKYAKEHSQSVESVIMQCGFTKVDMRGKTRQRPTTTILKDQSNWTLDPQNSLSGQSLSAYLREENLKIRLRNSYPNGVVENLSKNKKLYDDVCYHAKTLGKTHQALLVEWKFTLVTNPAPAQIKDFDQRVQCACSELRQIFPDGYVHNLQRTNNLLEQKIRRLADYENQTYSGFLHSHGFRTEQTPEERLQNAIAEVQKELQHLFPNKIILGSLQMQNQYLYKKIYAIAKLQGLTFHEQMRQWGYAIVRQSHIEDTIEDERQ